MDQIDQKLCENQRNLQNMENFLENKRIEVFELQNFIIKEFQNFQAWADQKDKLKSIFANQIHQLIADVRYLLTAVFQQTQQIASQVFIDAAKIFHSKVEQQDKDIRMRDQMIKDQMQEIQSLKYQIGRSNSPNFTNKKLISRQISESRQNILSKSQSKHNVVEFHINRIKAQDKQRDSHSKQRRNDEADIRLQKSSMMQTTSYGRNRNMNDQDSKVARSPVKRKVTYEVQRVDNEDLENKLNFEHKRYVKEKIQNLKSKNSGIFNQLKMERRF